MLKIKSLKNHAWKFFGTEKSTKLRFESKRNNKLISDLPK